MGNQSGNAGNQGGNLSTAVEMTQNSNGNDKFKASSTDIKGHFFPEKTIKGHR